jgi:hypothetical protein
MSHDRIRLQYKPVAGPRRRVTFEPDRTTDAADLAWTYWRIEEVYETETGRWREVGREHVTEPDLVIESTDAVADLAVPTRRQDCDGR